MKTRLGSHLCGLAFLFLAVLLFRWDAYAFRAGTNDLPNLDRRRGPTAAPAPETPSRRAALARLQSRVPGVVAAFDEVTGGVAWLHATDGFLTGRNGAGRGGVAPAPGQFAPNDRHRVAKAFLQEHRDLFGHGPELLATARLRREFTTPHNGLQSAVWEQELDGLTIFGATLTTHITRDGELVNLGSRFVPQAGQAADKGAARRGKPRNEPLLSARAAVARAAQHLGESLAEAEVRPLTDPANGAERRQTLAAAPLKGESHARLMWLPLSRDELRLCWEIILVTRTRGEMFRLLIDADSGEVLVRRCLTHYLTEATYRVFIGDSPSPFSPGWPTRNVAQPPLTMRDLVTLSALDTNASPVGWIFGNETHGNNVDAHLDRNGDDVPDLPRPAGLAGQVFDFPLDLNDEPQAYGEASAVQLFYRNNWIHDRLYELGFTEAAGNFQTTNFGRGGLGGDALLAQSQDGSDVDNANISVGPDGLPPIMQMFIFTGPTPHRDSSLDSEIVIHEYVHGLSERRVGGGEGLSEIQSRGMGEGWSDFYALCLLSEPGDDPDAAYASGAYSSHQLGGLTENYYFGIRRYPYTTDLARNPLTFADIDPSQAGTHVGVPLNPLWPVSNFDPAEVHAVGEVWCNMLWEARAALVRQHGSTTGNQLILQLVTDGMNLSPIDPTFVEARDAILLADRVLTGGANQQGLWASFARRGLGVLAVAPPSFTTFGVEPSFETPGDMGVLPTRGYSAHGPAGGPLSPSSQDYVVKNLATNPIPWSVVHDVSWLTVLPASGVLPAGEQARVTVTLLPAADLLTNGHYEASLTFSNHATGRIQIRHFALDVGLKDFFTEYFGDIATQFDLAYTTLTFTPDGTARQYFACREPALTFPVDTSDGQVWESFPTVPQIELPGAQVALFGRRYRTLFLGAGFIQFQDARPFYDPNNVVQEHFSAPHVTAFSLFQASYYSTATWKVLDDRFAVTFDTRAYNFEVQSQIEMFFDGRIRITFQHVDFSQLLNPTAPTWTITGLASWNYEGGFESTDLSAYGSCLHVSLPPRTREGDGVLVGQGRVTLPAVTTSNLTVHLTSQSSTNVAVPKTVTVAAGEQQAAFDIEVIDDTRLDGTQAALIAARTTRFGQAEATILAEDNETATLILSLPATAMESPGGAVIAGRLTISAPPDSDVTVALSSSAPGELQPPPAVVIPAGQTAASFGVTVLDDDRLDGPRATVITAHVANWPEHAATVIVGDDEPATLTLGLPPEVCEGAVTLTQAGLLSLGGVAVSNVTVTLTSGRLNRLRVPPVLTIPAGKSAARFDLMLVDNGVQESSETVTVMASAPGFSGGSGSLVVRDDESPAAPFGLQPENGSAEVPLRTRFRWQVESPVGEIAFNGDFETGDFGGWRRETPYGDSEDASFYINAGNIDPYGPERPTPPYAGRYCVVGDQIGPSIIRLSQRFSVPPCEGRVWLRWVDRLRNHADRFTEHQRFWVEISQAFDGQTGTGATGSGTRLGNGLGPFDPVEVYSTAPGDTRLNDWTERAVEISRFRGQTVDISFSVESSLYFITLFVDNISVMAQSGTNSVVYELYLGETADSVPPSLIGTTTNLFLDSPPLEPATAYSWHVVATKDGSAASAPASFITRNQLHFAWSAVAPTQFVGQPLSVMLTLRDELERPVARDLTAQLTGVDAATGQAVRLSTDSLRIVEGVWSGSVDVLESSPDLFLRATADEGITGESGRFAVLAPDDLALKVTAPTEATVGEPLGYRIFVTNAGPSSAHGILVTNHLPAGVALISMTTSGGTCLLAGGIVSCDLGSLGPESAVTMEFVVRPSAPGLLTNRCSVTRAEADFFGPNNLAETVTVAFTPTLFARDTSAFEDLQAAAIFEVELRPASSSPVSVRFATADGTAMAGVDYVGTNGLLVFAPGQTVRTIVVPILGDQQEEDAEEFTVHLLDATNAPVARAVATGRIIDYEDQLHIEIGPAAGREGETVMVPISLSHSSRETVTARFRTVDYTARAPDDYVATNLQISFPPGTTNVFLPITTRPDLICEGVELFYVEGSDASTNVHYINSQALQLFEGYTPPVMALAAVQLVEEEFAPPNRLIDSGERVTVSVEIRTTCLSRTTNVIATLLPSGGVSNPSAPQVYGSEPWEPRPFSFTGSGTNGAPLTLTFVFHDGASLINTQRFRLFLGPTPDFAIASLSTNGCEVVDPSPLAGARTDALGGLAASASGLFLPGDNGLVRFPLEELNAGGPTDHRLFYLVSNLRTETVYLLESDGGELFTLGPSLTSLMEIDGETGARTGNRIPLSLPIQFGPAAGLYSGYDRIVVHTELGFVYSISLPWGDVTYVDAVNPGPHLTTPRGTYWGVAEHHDGDDHLVYARDATRIVRKRVSDAFTTTVTRFDSLGDMGAFTVSIPRQHWYFISTTLSQFQPPPALGYCDATFAITDEVRLVSIDYVAPIVRLRFTSLAGRIYRLERRSTFAAFPWTTVVDNLVGTGRVMELTDASAFRQAFYRLRVLR